MSVFEGLSEKLRGIVNKLKGSARITEKDVKDIMRETGLRSWKPMLTIKL